MVKYLDVDVRWCPMLSPTSINKINNHQTPWWISAFFTFLFESNKNMGTTVAIKNLIKQQHVQTQLLNPRTLKPSNSIKSKSSNHQTQQRYRRHLASPRCDARTRRSTQRNAEISQSHALKGGWGVETLNPKAFKRGGLGWAHMRCVARRQGSLRPVALSCLNPKPLNPYTLKPFLQYIIKTL